MSHLVSKGGRCVGLTTYPPSCADCLEILGASTSCSLVGLTRSVQGSLLPLWYKGAAFQNCAKYDGINRNRKVPRFIKPKRFWERRVSCQHTSNAPDEDCVFLSVALSHLPRIEWVTQVTLDSCHNFWMQFSIWDCSWLNLQWMKSVGKLNGKTHFEGRDGVYEMGSWGNTISGTDSCSITRLRRTSGTRTRIKQNFVSKNYFVRMYICINKPTATLKVI